jgi:hypothetical protein
MQNAECRIENEESRLLVFSILHSAFCVLHSCFMKILTASSVMAQTLQRIRELGHTAALLPARYDIDVIEDLQRFAVESRDAEGELPKLLRALGIAA